MVRDQSRWSEIFTFSFFWGGGGQRAVASSGPSGGLLIKKNEDFHNMNSVGIGSGPRSGTVGSASLHRVLGPEARTGRVSDLTAVFCSGRVLDRRIDSWVPSAS